MIPLSSGMKVRNLSCGSELAKTVEAVFPGTCFGRFGVTQPPLHLALTTTTSWKSVLLKQQDYFDVRELSNTVQCLAVTGHNVFAPVDLKSERGVNAP